MTRTYTRRQGVDSQEVPIQNDEQSMSIEDTAAGRGLPTGGIATEPVYSEKLLSDEAFMAQPVEISLHEPTNENEPTFAEVTVNGNYRLLHRDNNVVAVPRSHVGVLCDAKVHRVIQQKTVGPDGAMGFREVVKTFLAYPFSVFHDPAGPKGRDWLKQKLNAPA